MKRTWMWLSFLSLVLLAGARAEAFIELNGFYYSSSESVGSTSSQSKMFYNAALGFRIDKKGQYLVGWGYSAHSTTESVSGVSTTYSSTEMGPRFLWFIDKDKNWSLGLAYFLVSSATRSASGSSETWKGTVIHGDVGYNIPLSENFLIGIRMNYSTATYGEKLVGSTDYSKVSYSKSFLYPSLSAVYIF